MLFPWSFSESKNLETVLFPHTLDTIGKYSFENSKSLIYIDIPDTIHVVDFGAFFICRKLKQVTIGYGVTTLCEFSFTNCDSLEDVYFKGNCPETVFSSDFSSFQIFSHHLPYPNIYYVEGTEGWDDPAKLDWLDPEKLFTWTPEAPYLFVSKKDPAGMKLVFSGELQSSDDLENWTTVPAESPYQDAPAQGSQKFFRVKK